MTDATPILPVIWHSGGMPFRSDRDAAHARAEALERELADRDRKLVAKEEALRAAEEKLAEHEREEVEKDAATDASTASELAPALQDLTERAAMARQQAADRAELALASRRAMNDASELSPEQRARQRRLEASMGWWVRVDWYVVPILAVLFGVGVGLRAVYWGTSIPLVLAAVALLGSVLAMILVRPLARRALRREYDWAAERGIEGYPELLACRPRDVRVPFQHHRGAEGHDELAVSLTFRASPPPRLDEVMGAVGLFRAGPERYRRESPVTSRRPNRRARRDISHGTEDHNDAVRLAVRALERDVLAPLRAAHELERVVIKLAPSHT